MTPSERASNDHMSPDARVSRVDVRVVPSILYWLGAGTALFVVAILLLLAGSLLISSLAALPVAIQAACAGLVIGTVIFLVNMWAERRRLSAAADRFLAIFSHVPPLTSDDKYHGLTSEALQEIRSKAQALRGETAVWWRKLDETIEEFTDSNGRRGWFLTRPVEEILPEGDVIDPIYHGSFHHAVPGLLTAMGLLATFAAILVALAGVSYDPGNSLHPVSGIDQLINGLSGKFLSSVIALILSLIFSLIERKLCDRHVYQRYQDVVRRCRETLPFLSQTRILLDMHRMASLNAGNVWK